MSSNPDRRHRATTSQDTITSPTAQQPPKFTPSSHLRLTPSNRTSLSEASNTSSRHSASTIRIVDDPARNVYDKFPLPSEPSQIFPPPRNAPGYAFETPGSRVSSGSRVANALAKFEAIGASSTLAPQPPSYRPKNTFRHSASTNTSEDDTLVGTGNSRSSFRFSQGSTPPVSPGQAELKDFDTELEVLEEETTPPARRSTIRPVPPSSSGGESVESRLRALSPQESVASFASNPTTASPTASPSSPSNADRNATGVIRPLPPTESEDTRQQALDIDDSHRQVVLKPSDESFAYSDISSTSIEPKQPTYSPSPPLYEASSATWSSGAKVTHPVVRPAANNQRVIPQDTPNIAARMLVDHGLEHNWSSQLSTIASVSERDSRSVTRTPRSFSPRSQSTDSYAEKSQTHLPLRRRGQTIGSYNSSSDNYSSSPSGSVVPLPLFSPQLSPSGEYNEKSFGDEDLDTVSPLPPSNTIRMKNSGYLRRKDSEASLASSVKSSRPGSSHSDVSTFNRSIIPAWARAYYQRGERISMIPAASESSGSIRLGTSHSGRTHTPSESNFPAHIYRPRNRPHNNRASHADTMSPMSLSSEQLIDENGYAAGSYPPSVSGWSTPHLRTDRRGQPRYSFWKAPSMDKDFGRHPFSRQNRQILLFTLGFIFFPSWWIASCLPLPYDPALVQNESQVDFEQQYAQQIALADNKAYQKANWWRNLNRVMSGVGTLLIGVIVVLAILASRM